jgi:hypothetical protein
MKKNEWLVLFIVYCNETERISTICPILLNKEKNIFCVRSNDSAWSGHDSISLSVQKVNKASPLPRQF